MAPDTRKPVVFMTGHPDDVAFFMGGTAVLLAKRYQLHVIVATRGECRDGAPSEAVAATREAEERECCAMLGATVEFLGLNDGFICATRAAVENVAEILKRIRPVALLSHGPQSKPDHAAVCILALQALYKAELFWETEMYMNLQDGESRHGRYAPLYVNISSVRDEKRALVACHRSHHPDPSSIEHFMDHDKLIGKLAWCEYAEAFMPGLPLVNERWDRRAGSVLLELSDPSAA
jgi:LmbE family N-acetylglucosaminyl deacetylase